MPCATEVDMVEVFRNHRRGAGLAALDTFPSDDATGVRDLLRECPAHLVTRLLDLTELAHEIGVASIVVKDERSRMGLGSFKALGAAYAIAREASLARGKSDWATTLSGRVFVTASAGNHGLSVAAGARLFGARAVIYLSASVPETFADRLRAKGAEVRRAGATYEESMAEAEAEAATERWTLLSDSSWPGYTEIPFRVMEGYLQMAAEIVEQVKEVPTHVLLQAGVGGMAAAVAAHARKSWGGAPVIIVVEPDAAPALIESVRAGKIVATEGPVSAMGRLDCKTPSMIALAGLARDADLFVTISEAEAESAVERLAAQGIATTPSGAAGLAALISGLPDMTRTARVLAILSEGSEVG